MYSVTILLLALRTMTALIVAATELLAETRKSLLTYRRARKPVGEIRPEDSWRSFF
jgi:hypothetical protein